MNHGFYLLVRSRCYASIFMASNRSGENLMQYLPVVVMMAAGFIVASAGIFVSHIMGPKIRSKFKDSPFECGVPPLGDARQRFSVRFYLVAILFLLFDVEALFFFPWAIIFKDYLAFGSFILIEMAVFIAVLLVGYIYAIKRGALEWD